jgi:hypothetical protein
MYTDQHYNILRSDVVQSDIWISKFRRKMLPPSSGRKIYSSSFLTEDSNGDVHQLKKLKSHRIQTYRVILNYLQDFRGL